MATVPALSESNYQPLVTHEDEASAGPHDADNEQHAVIVNITTTPTSKKENE
jgi:hypothetical protein